MFLRPLYLDIGNGHSNKNSCKLAFFPDIHYLCNKFFQIMKHNDLNRQASIVLLKIIAFFIVYLLLLAYGGAFVYAVYYIFIHYLQQNITDAYIQGENLRLVILILLSAIPGCFLLLYGLYPLKFVFRKGNKHNAERRETSEDESPLLYRLVKEVAMATGNKMPKHIYVTADVNAGVFYDNTLKSILFPTRKNLFVGLGLFVNANTEEVKAILSHEFGHFAQSSMRIGSVIYYLNMLIYEMAFQEDHWDAILDKFFRSLITTCRFAGFYGIIGMIMLIVLYRILFFTKDVLRWMYRFVNRSYYSLSRQMEYDADRVACNVVGKDVFISSLIKVAFASNCEENAKVAWKRLISAGKYACFFNVFTQYENIKAQELENPISYYTLESHFEDIEEIHSNISFTNVFSDHPSAKERINAVSDMSQCQKMAFTSAWQLIAPSVLQECEDALLSMTVNENYYKQLKQKTAVDDQELSEWIKNDYETQALPKKYRPFFEHTYVFDLEKVNVTGKIDNPFTDANRQVFLKYFSSAYDSNLAHQLVQQDEIKYASYMGKIYMVHNLPTNIIDESARRLFDKCLAIEQQVYAYLVSNSEKDIKSMYLYTFAGINIVNGLNDLDEDYEKLRERISNPNNDDDEPDDFWDMKLTFSSFMAKKLKPMVLACEQNIFPMCANMGADAKLIDNILNFAKSPTPDYTNYPIQQVIDSINDSINFKHDVVRIINGMVNMIDGELVNIAKEIEEQKCLKKNSDLNKVQAPRNL